MEKSNYLLSARHQPVGTLAALVNEDITSCRYETLEQLRAIKTKSLYALLRHVISIKVRRAYYCQTDVICPLTPLVLLMLLFSRARAIYTVSPNGVTKHYRRYLILLLLFKLLIATLKGFSIVQRSTRQLLALKKCLWNRARVTNDFRKGLFINANLTFDLKAGGSIGHIAGVLNALSNEGHQMTYAAMLKNPMQSEHINFIQLEMPNVLLVPFELNLFMSSQRIYRQMLQYCSNNRPDYIYQRLSIADFTGARLAKAFNLPLIVEYNGSEVWIAKNWGNPCLYEKQLLLAEEVMLNAAHTVVTISDVLRDELISRGVSSDRIVCYPNCVDLKQYHSKIIPYSERVALRDSIQVSDDALICTFVGTFGRWHGVVFLAKVIVKLYESSPSWLQKTPLHFLFVGAGQYFNEVKQLIEGSAASEHVTFLGVVPQSETPQYLAISDIFLSPHVPNPDGSRFFGSPTKLFEYMAMAKPVIASDIEQIGNILLPSLYARELPKKFAENSAAQAVLCEPENYQDYINALEFLASNPSWRSLLGENALQCVTQKYTWYEHVRQILNHIEQ